MVAVRPRDTVRVEILASETIQGGTLENFTSLIIRNDLTMPSEASFEVGDEGTWNSIGNAFEPGVEFQIYINDTPRLRGRVEMNDVPLDVSAGAVVRFTVRTKLSDAMYASANHSVKVKGATVKQFVLDLYAPLGYAESDFEFDQATSRQIIVGRPIPSGADTEAIVEARDRLNAAIREARVKPPETIYAAADRHLRKIGLMHWDGPTGKIVVGAPNDANDPAFAFNMFRNNNRSSTNNISGASRTRDWSGVPSVVNVYGRGGPRANTKKAIAAAATAADVTAAGFYRPVTVLAEGVKKQAEALKAANRELASRSKSKDSFSIDLDGFSFWNGQETSLYAPDTVALINTDVAGGDSGAYFIHATTFTRNASDGDTTQLDLLRRGIWQL